VFAEDPNTAYVPLVSKRPTSVSQFALSYTRFVRWKSPTAEKINSSLWLRNPRRSSLEHPESQVAANADEFCSAFLPLSFVENFPHADKDKAEAITAIARIFFISFAFVRLIILKVNEPKVANHLQLGQQYDAQGYKKASLNV
jgi:hypothetical protein